MQRVPAGALEGGSLGMEGSTASSAGGGVRGLLFRLGEAAGGLAVQPLARDRMSVTEAFAFFLGALSLTVSFAELETLRRHFGCADSSCIDMVAVLGRAKATFDKYCRCQRADVEVKREHAQWAVSKVARERRPREQVTSRQYIRNGKSIAEVNRKIADVRAKIERLQKPLEKRELMPSYRAKLGACAPTSP